jgi:ADP-ribose pyrophosphatase YjhB (NUDIX family)
LAINFCSHCGVPVRMLIPEGDDRPRPVCPDCGRIHYVNPKVVVGAIPLWDGKILLCRRAIEPRRGLWTLPAGFLESGETVEAGARRETREEAGAELADMEPFALFNLPFVSQIYLMFRANLLTDSCSAGDESLEVGLFSEPEIPWDELAFTVMRETLRLYYADLRGGAFSFHIGDITPA